MAHAELLQKTGECDSHLPVKKGTQIFGCDLQDPGNFLLRKALLIVLPYIIDSFFDHVIADILPLYPGAGDELDDIPVRILQFMPGDRCLDRKSVV